MAWRSDRSFSGLSVYIYTPPEGECERSGQADRHQSESYITEEQYQEDPFSSTLTYYPTSFSSPIIKIEEESYEDCEITTNPVMNRGVAKMPNTVPFDEFCRQLRLEADVITPWDASPASSFSPPKSDRSSDPPDTPVSSVLSIADKSMSTSTSTSPLTTSTTPCPRRAVAVVIPKRTNRQMFTRYDSEDHGEYASEDSFEDCSITRPEWIKTRKPSIPDNTVMMSASQLRHPEYPPRHERWTSIQQLLICGLCRWYTSTDSRDWSAYTMVFNSITGLSLRERVVQTQFDTLRYMGPKVYPEYAAIWRTPFDDPKGKFDALHSVVETEARKMGLNLVRRTSERILSCGTAARSKSETARKRYKRMVAKAKTRHFENPFEGSYATAFAAELLNTTRPATAADLPKPATHLRPTKPMDTLNQRGIADSFKELSITPFTPTESSSHVHTQFSLELSDAWPPFSASLPNDSPLSVSNRVVDCLAFRVWDANSRTVFTDDGFVADLFQDRYGPVTRPLPRNDEYGLFDVLAVKHLSLRGNASAFVSVAASLLQVMKYTGKMTDPHCAVIALDHPDLSKENKLHWTKDVINHLRRQGEMKWARYRGGREYLSWGNIPMSCILHAFPLSELTQLCSGFDDVTNLMDLNLFTQGLKTQAVAEKLRQKHTVLDIKVARSMGQVARCFGLAKSDVRAGHIKDFVSCLVDGWSIHADVDNILVFSDFARHFAMAMGPSRCLHIQEVMNAFMEGVMQGSENLKYYSKIRSRSGKNSRQRS